jgi:hypothetical protein
MTAFTALLLVLILWYRKKIAVAIAIIKEASSALCGCCGERPPLPRCCLFRPPPHPRRTATEVLCCVSVPPAEAAIPSYFLCFIRAAVAVRDMKSLLFYPIVTFLLVAALMVYWIFVTAFLASTGDDIDVSAVAASAQVRSVRGCAGCVPGWRVCAVAGGGVAVRCTCAGYGGWLIAHPCSLCTVLKCLLVWYLAELCG